MTKQQMAEDIERTMRESKEHITALKAVLRRTMGTLQLAKLESDVLDELAQGRADPSYLRSVAQLEREMADAKEDGDLIRILYREGLEKENIPMN
jgi:hypothetical protein